MQTNYTIQSNNEKKSDKPNWASFHRTAPRPPLLSSNNRSLSTLIQTNKYNLHSDDHFVPTRSHVRATEQSFSILKHVSKVLFNFTVQQVLRYL